MPDREEVITLKGRIVGFKLLNTASEIQSFLVFRTSIILQGSTKYLRLDKGFYYISFRNNRLYIKGKVVNDITSEINGNFLEFYIPNREILISSKKNVAFLRFQSLRNQWMFLDLKIVLREL